MVHFDTEVPAKIKKTITSIAKNAFAYSPNEALALYVDGDFTKHSYKLMQSGAKIRNVNIYPSYDALLLAKKNCYPIGVQFTDTSAEVSLQTLVDHTITRIVESQNDIFVNRNEEIIRQSFSDSESNRNDKIYLQYALCHYKSKWEGLFYGRIVGLLLLAFVDHLN